METVSISIYIPSISLTLIPITIALPIAIAMAVFQWLRKKLRRPRSLTLADYTMGQIER